MPLAFVTYSLAYLDRNNFGYAAGSMTLKLGLSPPIAALLPAMFFAGYFLFQIPAIGFAARHSVRWVVFYSLVVWGVLSSLTGILQNVPLLLLDRFLLGAVEGVVLPAMLVYLSRWFTRSERSRANSFLMVGNPITMMYASVLSATLIQSFTKHPLGGYQGWQMMFIAEGVPSVLWAFVWVMLARDRPADAEWLMPDEAAAVQNRLDAEQGDVAHVRDYWSAFFDARVILLSLMFFFFSAPAYAFMFWMPEIVKNLTGRGIAAAGLLLVVPYMVASIALIAVSWWSDKTLHRKSFVWGSLLLGSIGWAVALAAGTSHFAVASVALIVVCCCMYTPTSPLWAWMAEMLPRNVIGESIALVNSAGAAGGFLGVYMGGWLRAYFHSPTPTLLFCSISLLVAAVLGLSVAGRRRDAVESAFPVTVIGRDRSTPSWSEASR